MITRDERIEESIFATREFQFDFHSGYRALRRDNNQIDVIQEHISASGIPVHYLLYNPVTLPWRVLYPRSGMDIVLPERTAGARVIHARDVHESMSTLPRSAPLRICNLVRDRKPKAQALGWTLEDFFEATIRCEEGYVFNANDDIGLRQLFYRKSGPIFCIVEIVIESAE